MSSISIRWGVRALAVVTAIGIAGVAAPASAETATSLSVKSIDFASNYVDARGDWTVIELKWTVANSDQAATDLRGVVKLHSLDHRGQRLGQLYEIDFELGETFYTKAQFVSGTAQKSTYRYDFVVPRYGRTQHSLWAVTEVALQDDRDNAATVRGAALSAARLAAGTLVDSTPPSLSWFYQEPLNDARPYAYVKDTIAHLPYYASVQDGQAGFWKGTLRLTGPSGQSVSSDFESVGVQYPTCGRYSGGDTYSVSCGIDLRLPAGTASGVWRVSALVLVDNVGNRTTVSDLGVEPVTVTSNEVVSASDFAATPNPVDNWTTDVTTQVSLAVTGAQGGVAEVIADFDSFGCRQTTTTPTAGADGTVSFPVRVFSSTAKCSMVGLVVRDGAGHVAVYGSRYEAPATGLSIDRLPNTTPPTAVEATVSPTTFARSRASEASPVVSVKVVAPIAPVNGYSLYLYDSAGNVVAQQFGGIGADADGYVRMYGYLPHDIAAGVYTYGFILNDASRLSSTYGPEGLPMPGGPLRITVTDD